MTKSTLTPIIIFGGNGYLGNALAVRLVELNCAVTVADLSDSNVSKGMEFVKTDITDAHAVKAAIPEGSLVINFAGIADLNQAKAMPAECIDINIKGNCNILQACVTQKAKKYCYASSAYVYSQHGSFYRISKRTCEEYVTEFGKKYNLPYLILRYGSLYGGTSNESNGMHRLVNGAMTTGKLHYDGFPTDRREFIHVSDASEITADLLLGDDVNQAFVLTGSESFTMEQLFALIAEIISKPIDISFGNDPHSDHYHMTQYNFVPIQAKKIANPRHVDIGNGIMNLINRLHVESKRECI